VTFDSALARQKVRGQ